LSEETKNWDRRNLSSGCKSRGVGLEYQFFAKLTGLDLSKIIWIFGSRLIFPKFSSKILMSELVELREVMESMLEKSLVFL
jgi:hypothetical protein